MIRLYFYVEGQTEQGYVARVLRPHLATFGVMVMGAILKASGRSHGTTFRGGGNYLPARRELLAQLKRHKGLDVRFTTMFDLYALPSDFPAFSEAASQHRSPSERIKFLEAAFAADIADHRLIPHLQLHEYESILLADPHAFALIYENADRGIAALKHAVAEVNGCPELVNDGRETAPSKRIIKEFPSYESGKPRDGVSAAECIPLNVVRQCSPHFDRWLKILEQLPNPTGQVAGGSLAAKRE